MNTVPALDSVADALGASSIRVTDEEARVLAQNHFGIDGIISRFATEKDDTFRVKREDGKSYTLKIANGAEKPSEISFQIDLLAYIAKKDPTIPVPKVIQNRDRRDQFAYVDRAGESRQVHLLTYLEGTPLSEVQSTAAQRRNVGEVLAKLRLAMGGYSHPADTREIAWDVKHLMKLRPLLAEIEDFEKRDLLERGLNRFEPFVDKLKKCRSQVLHNDFSKSNIVVNFVDNDVVSGVIDFGDAVRTAVAVDVSTALLNQLPGAESDDFLGQPLDLLRGYLGITDLSDEELALIPHLIMGRVIARALLTTWRGRLFPKNAKYILRNTGQGWHQLQWFMERSVHAISGDFMAAARG
ncbi:MAG: phosphotransferase [Afipia sp.]|nr:phosphotransferase [Afipia sp.]